LSHDFQIHGCVTGLFCSFNVIFKAQKILENLFYNHGCPQIFLQGWVNFCPFQVADDETQMDVHKTL